MRVGQLARKYDVTIQDIISFINEVEPYDDSLHSNTKLTEQMEELIADNFQLSADESEEQIDWIEERVVEEIKEVEEEPAEQSIEPQISEREVSGESANSEFDLLLPESEYSPEFGNEMENSSQKIEVIDPVLEEKAPDLPEKEEFVIESDQLLEQLESEEPTIDLSKVTKIKAPKKELDGLKVVGKIDLPEAKVKVVEEIKDQESELKTGRHHRQQVSDEEKEKRRLRAKKKKEDYDERNEARKIEREKKQEKARKEAHYRQKIQQQQPSQPKRKAKVEVEVEVEVEIQQEVLEVKAKRPQPKSVFGKMWRWLNPKEPV